MQKCGVQARLRPEQWSPFAEPLPSHLPPCSAPGHQFVRQRLLYSLNSPQQVPGHLPPVPFPAPSPVRLIGGLCWKHFKLVFSLSRLVVRRLLSKPNAQLWGLAFWPWRLGGFFPREFWKAGVEVKRWREGPSPGLAVALIHPQSSVPDQGPHHHTWLLSVRRSWQPGHCGNHCLNQHHFLWGWWMPDRASNHLGAGRAPQRAPATYSILQLNPRSNISLTTLSGQRLIMAYI